MGDVRTLPGSDAIATQTQDLLSNASDEIILVIGDDRVRSEMLFDHLKKATDRRVRVYIGTLSRETIEGVAKAVPMARTFTTGLTWLQGPTGTNDWNEHVEWADIVVFDDSFGLGTHAEQLRAEGIPAIGGTQLTDW